MTQASASDTATTPGGEQNAAPPPLLDPSLRESLAPELLAQLDQQTAPASDGDNAQATPAQQQPPSAANAGGTEAEADGGEPGGEPDDRVATFVDLIDENPANISQVPRDLQAQVITQWKSEYETAATTALQNIAQQYDAQGYQRAQREFAVREAEAIDKLFSEGDDEAANERLKTFPGGARGYHRVKADLPDGPAEANTPAHFQQQLNELVKGLDAYPDALAKFQQGFAGKGYKADQASLLRAAQDIGELIAEAKAATPDPARVAVQARRNGIERARQTPKADNTAGSAGSADEMTREKLKTMSAQQIMEWQEKNPGKLDAILAKA